MIEINLIPDIKRELLQAQKIRSAVITGAIFTAIAAASVVVLLVLYVVAGQTFRMSLADRRIEEQNAKLQSVQDLSNTLTIQNQLEKLSTAHDAKKINSRVFDVLNTINPPRPNDVSVAKVILNAEESTVLIEAQANGGYTALEVFKKTIEATRLQYTPKDSNETTSVFLAADISYSNVSFGEDSSGNKTLRFTVSFVYPEELFARASQNAVIIAPTKTNVTDSFVNIPKSLFTTKASDIEEDQ